MASTPKDFGTLFAHLRTDRGQRYPAATRHCAPHKPFLLLSVLDLFARGSLTTNLILPDLDLGELFVAYWSRIMPADWEGSLTYPFFHLTTSGFWTLIAQPGQTGALAAVGEIRTIGQLRWLVQGAQLDADLFETLSVEATREALRDVLIQTYFTPDVQPILWEQAHIHLQSYQYSEELLEEVRAPSIPVVPIPVPTYEPARSQGFRRAVVTAYCHRCALCGVRLVTEAGHSAVDAAHIVPWRQTHNDDPRNGLALCGLCHWTFDEGLIAISTEYLVRLSPQLKYGDNIPGHLLTLEGRGMIGPEEAAFWPDVEALRWHYKQCFQK